MTRMSQRQISAVSAAILFQASLGALAQAPPDPSVAQVLRPTKGGAIPEDRVPMFSALRQRLISAVPLGDLSVSTRDYWVERFSAYAASNDLIFVGTVISDQETRVSETASMHAIHMEGVWIPHDEPAAVRFTYTGPTDSKSNPNWAFDEGERYFIFMRESPVSGETYMPKPGFSPLPIYGEMVRFGSVQIPLGVVLDVMEANPAVPGGPQ